MARIRSHAWDVYQPVDSYWWVDGSMGRCGGRRRRVGENMKELVMVGEQEDRITHAVLGPEIFGSFGMDERD